MENLKTSSDVLFILMGAVMVLAMHAGFAFLELGTGVVYVEPRATIVLPEDRTDQTAYVGAGLRFYLTRRFFVRADYRWHTVFTSRDDNEELEEWKVQIACFF